eukprot:jgi/Chlat1/3589/Chrsp234S03579
MTWRVRLRAAILLFALSCLVAATAPAAGKEEGAKEATAAARAFFRSLDRNLDGAIDSEEAREFVGQQLGDSPDFDSEAEIKQGVKQLLGHLDVNHGLTISETELLSHLARRDAKLTADAVAEWVAHGVKLPQYSKAFAANAVTALDFPTLLAQDGAALDRDLGVTSRLHREQLLRALKMQVLGIGKAPSEPSQLACSVNGDKVALQWDPPEQEGFPPVHSYEIRRRSEHNPYWELYGAITDTGYLDRNLQPDTVYSYRVTAWGAYGHSKPATVDCKTAAQPRSSKSSFNASLPVMVVSAVLGAVVLYGLWSHAMYHKTPAKQLVSAATSPVPPPDLMANGLEARMYESSKSAPIAPIAIAPTEPPVAARGLSKSRSNPNLQVVQRSSPLSPNPRPPRPPSDNKPSGLHGKPPLPMPLPAAGVRSRHWSTMRCMAQMVILLEQQKALRSQATSPTDDSSGTSVDAAGDAMHLSSGYESSGAGSESPMLEAGVTDVDEWDERRLRRELTRVLSDINMSRHADGGSSSGRDSPQTRSDGMEVVAELVRNMRAMGLVHPTDIDIARRTGDGSTPASEDEGGSPALSRRNEQTGGGHGKNSGSKRNDPDRMRYRCKVDGCRARFDRWYKLGDWRMTFRRHYCGGCQGVICPEHTRYSPHGPAGKCDLESTCLCEACFSLLPPDKQQALDKKNKISRSMRSERAQHVSTAPSVFVSQSGVTTRDAAPSPDNTHRSSLFNSDSGQSTVSSGSSKRRLSLKNLLT